MEQQKEGIRQEFMLLNWYLKEHLASAVRIAAFIGVFSLLCFLRNVPQDVTVYMIVLMAAVGAAGFCFHYGKYRKHHLVLALLAAEPQGKTEALPEADGLLARDYQQIIASYEPVHCEVLTDEKWLVFVLEQILSNALKYTKSGSIHIYLSPDAPKTLVIEDTGIGIAPEDLPRIFEKGYTGCNGRADKRSTGIGLYLCRQIMEKLSHTIRIESEMGAGTKVYLGLDTVSL